MRNFLSLFDVNADEIERIFAITDELKKKYDQGVREPLLPGRVMALLFERPSLRTRVSFEAGIIHLGGSSLFLGQEVGFGKRESPADFGRVLSEYVDVIVVRAGSHQTAIDLSSHSSCSVINGLTDREHPCQALSDLYALKERVGSLRGRTLAWVGDGNNVARSLAIGCARVGMRFVAASPAGYQLEEAFLAEIHKSEPEADIVITESAQDAVQEATAVYTDIWASMGQDTETEKRKQDFAAYQVNAELMSRAPADAFFMHCLPAHRGEEVTSEVIDSEQSIVVAQAATRLHVQKGIMAWLLNAPI